VEEGGRFSAALFFIAWRGRWLAHRACVRRPRQWVEGSLDSHRPPRR